MMHWRQITAGGANLSVLYGLDSKGEIWSRVVGATGKWDKIENPPQWKIDERRKEKSATDGKSIPESSLEEKGQSQLAQQRAGQFSAPVKIGG